MSRTPGQSRLRPDVRTWVRSLVDAELVAVFLLLESASFFASLPITRWERRFVRELPRVWKAAGEMTEARRRKAEEVAERLLVVLERRAELAEALERIEKFRVDVSGPGYPPPGEVSLARVDGELAKLRRRMLELEDTRSKIVRDLEEQHPPL